jgi:hypothetical protein
MKTKNTPLPWKVKPYLTPQSDSDPLGVYVVEQAMERLTVLDDAIYYGDHDGPEQEKEQEEKEQEVHDENRANANLIERAVNSHEELLTSLKHALMVITDLDPQVPGIEAAKEMYLKAIERSEV